MNTAPYAALGKYMDLLLDTLCVVDKNGHFLYVSAGCERLLGYTQQELLGRQMLTLVHPDDRHITLRTVDQILAGEAQPNFENRYIHKNGEEVHILWSARWSEEDQCRVAVARDITLRKQAETMQSALFAISEASHNTEDLASLYQQIHRIISQLLPADNCVIARYDEATGTISFPYYANGQTPAPAAYHLQANTVYAQVLTTGQSLLLDAQAIAAASGDPSFTANSDGQTLQTWLGVPLKNHGRVTGALVLKTYQTSVHYSDKNVALLQFVSTQIAAAIERRQLLEHLQQHALYDHLTRLPNRKLFSDRFQSAVARAKRTQGLLSLFFLDLDKFKEVNDQYGHSMGDLLLENVARRLELSVRECDTIARFGGDEFVVLVENIDYPQQSDAIAEKIYLALSQPYDLQGTELTILPSLGIAHFPLHGESETALLRHADNAMYQDKTSKT